MSLSKKYSTTSLGTNYQLFSYGFHPKGSYTHRSKHCEIQSVTHNNKTGELIIVDSRGIISWMKNFVSDHSKRVLEFSSYEYNSVKILLYCSKYNVYFALSKGYRLQVFNLNFSEIFSLDSDSVAAHYICLHDKLGEVIAVGQSCIRIWTYGEILNKTNPMLSTFGLHLKCEIKTWENMHISKVEIDQIMDRLYCLVENQVWCYNMEGHFVFKADSVTTTHITACLFAPVCHFLVTGCIDGKVHVITTTGNAVHTFELHARVITNLLIHPSDNQLILSSSLDGSVKMISLDTMEEIYSFPVFTEGIYWMQIRGQSQIHCSSNKNIEILDLNFLCGMWAPLPYNSQSVDVVKSGHRSSKVVVVGEDYNVKVFSKRSKKLLTTILPPPPIDPLHDVISWAYDASGGLLYLLIDHWSIWVYTTRTDPASRIITWRMENLCGSGVREGLHATQRDSGSQRYPNLEDEDTKCRSLCIVDFKDIVHKGIGGNELVNGIRPLLCGMDDGTIVLVDSHKEGSKNRKLKVASGPIIQVKICRDTGTLVLISQSKQGLLIHLIDSGQLHETRCYNLHQDLTCFDYKNETIALGFTSGEVKVITGCCKSINQVEEPKQDHKGVVVSVAFDHMGEIICTTGGDGYLKLWDTDKVLLCDFYLGDTLTSACFLNAERDIIFGFKKHVYYISSDILSSHGIIEEQDDTATVSDQDSAVFESPYLRFDRRRQTFYEHTTMENYLVPYDYLKLDESFLKDSCTNVIIDPFEETVPSRKSSMLSMSEMSFASTAIYGSIDGSVHDSESERYLPFFGESPTQSLCLIDDTLMSLEQLGDSIFAPTVSDEKSSEQNERAKSEQSDKVAAPENEFKFSKGFSQKLNQMRIDSKNLRTKRKTKRPNEQKRQEQTNATGDVLQIRRTKKKAKKKRRHKDRGKGRSTEKNEVSADASLPLEIITQAQSPALTENTELTNKEEIIEAEEVYQEVNEKEQTTEANETDVSFGRAIWSNAFTIEKFEEVSEPALTVSHDVKRILSMDRTNDEPEDEEVNLTSDDLESEDSDVTIAPIIDNADIAEDANVEIPLTASTTSLLAPSPIPVQDVLDIELPGQNIEDLKESSSGSLDEEESTVIIGTNLYDRNRKFIRPLNIAAPKRVRFKPRQPFLRTKQVSKERVIPLSNLRSDNKGPSTDNKAPLSILSLARKRKDSVVGTSESELSDIGRLGERKQKPVDEEENQSKVSGKISKVTAIRLEKQHSGMHVANNPVPVRKPSIGEPEDAIGIPISSDKEGDNHAEKSRTDLMKFCLSSFKRPSPINRHGNARQKREINSLSTEALGAHKADSANKMVDSDRATWSRSNNFSSVQQEDSDDRKRYDFHERSISALSGRSDSISSEYDRRYAMTPSVIIRRRPCSPSSQVSGSVDYDKVAVDFDTYFEQQLQAVNDYRQVSRIESEFSRPKTENAHCHSRCIAHRHIPIDDASGVFEKRTVAKATNSESLEALKRIKSAGLRNELMRRKMLSSQRSARQASALERRNENEVHRRRCISASPSLFRHESNQSSVNDDNEFKISYEYTCPTPLRNQEEDRAKTPSHRRLEAKLAGQPFRYGEKFNLDEGTERTLVAFARLAISKSSKPLMLPKQHTSVSIPTKCRDFILVKEPKSKNKVKFTRMEQELLKQRFQSFTTDESNCFKSLIMQ